MTSIGFAPTQDIPRMRAARPAPHPVTAPAFAVVSDIRLGAVVDYHGSSVKNRGWWIADGPCRCGCGGLRLWRRRLDGLHRLVHVNRASVTVRFPW